MKFRKTEFRSLGRVNGKISAIKRTGYTDGEFYYYQTATDKMWTAIDPESGLSVGNKPTRKEIYNFVHSDEMKKNIKEAKKTERYKSSVSIFYKALVECGAIMENLIK